MSNWRTWSILRRSGQALPRLEPLEDRRLLAAIYWDGDADDDGGDNHSWSDPHNWSLDRVPNSEDDVHVGGPADTVSFGGTIRFENGGSLSVSSGVTLSGSSISIQDGGSLSASGAVFNASIGFSSGSIGSISSGELRSISIGDDDVSISGNDITGSLSVSQLSSWPNVSGNTFSNTSPASIPIPFLPELASNSFDTNGDGDATIVLTTNAVDEDMSWSTIGDAIRFSLTNGLTVRDGAELNIGSGLEVTGNGSITVGSGDPGSILDASGALFGISITFSSLGSGGLSNCEAEYVSVRSPAVTLASNIFTSTVSVDNLFPTITGNTFEGTSPLSIYAEQSHAILTQNDFTSPDPATVTIKGGEVLSDTTWRDYGSIDKYRLTSTVTVLPGVALSIDQVELTSDSYSRYIYADGSLDLSNVDVTGEVQLQARAGAQMDLLDVTTAPNYVGIAYNYASMGGSVQHSSIRSLSLYSWNAPLVRYNDFSSGTVTLNGQPDSTVDLRWNWWGTTDPAEIETKINHHVDDPNRPLAIFDPFLDEPPSGDTEPDVLIDAQDLGILGDSLELEGFVGDGDAGAKDVDLYRFELLSPRDLTIDIDAYSLGTGLDGYVRLFELNGEEIALGDDGTDPDDGGESLDPYKTVTIGTGVYYLGVSGYGNIGYDVSRPDSGVPGSTGEYTLVLSTTAPGDPPGDGVPVGAFNLVGNFEERSDGTWASSGTVIIGDLVRLEGSVFFDGAGKIWGSAAFWLDDIPVFGDVEVYEGYFSFDPGSTVTSEINQAMSGLSVLGMDVKLDGFMIMPDELRLQGSIILAEELGGWGVRISGEDWIRIGPNIPYGFDFTGQSIVFPDVTGLKFFGLEFAAEDVEFRMASDEIEIRGKVELGNLLGGTVIDLSTDGNHIAITEGDNGLPEVEVVGSLQIEGPIHIGPGFSLRDLILDVDTSEHRLFGGGKLDMPTFDLSVYMGFVDGYFDSIYVEASDLDIWVLTTPTPPPVPVLILEAADVSIENVAPGPPSVVLGGGMDFVAGPEIELGDKSYYLLGLELDADYDTAGRFTGTGLITLGGGEDPFRLADGTVIIDKDEGLSLSGAIHLPYMDISGSMALHRDNSLYGSLYGELYAPGWLGGGTLADAGVYVQYVPDEDYTNDFLMGGGQIFGFGVTLMVNLNDGEVDWSAGFDGLPGGKGIDPHEYIVPANAAGAIFHLDWELGEADVELQAPDGTIYTPANVGDHPGIDYYEDPDTLQSSFIVQNPAEGTWTYRVLNDDQIGTYGVNGYLPSQAPSIEVVAPQYDTAEQQVLIEWLDDDPDSDASVSLFYDRDRSGADGKLIVSGLSEDDLVDSYMWDTTDVAAGEYYIYAVISDGQNEPVVSYSTGQVTVANLQGPAAVTGLHASVGTDTSVTLEWDAHSDPDVVQYVLRFTPDAAGEFEPTAVVAGDVTVFELDELVPGEAYRVSIAAIDVDNMVGEWSEPVIVVPSGNTTVDPGDGEWSVWLTPGQTYLATAPGEPGATFEAVDLPGGATLDPATGELTWDVPVDAAGWYDVLLHVTEPDGSKQVVRRSLYADLGAPTQLGTLDAAAALDGSITLTAAGWTDDVGVLEYQFERDGLVIGDWQLSPIFVDDQTTPTALYEYRVRAREASPAKLESGWSTPLSLHAAAQTPGEINLGEITPDSITINTLATDDNSQLTQYAVRVDDLYLNLSGQLLDTPTWALQSEWAGVTAVGLEANTYYSFAALAKNADGLITEPGAAVEGRTEREQAPPQVLDLAYEADNEALVVTFSELVLFTLKDMELTDSTGDPIDLPDALLTWSDDHSIATIALGQTLPDGDYTLTLFAAAIQDPSANLLDGDGDGIGGDDAVLDVAIQHDTEAPIVVGFTINGGDVQRSWIDTIDVTFSEDVTPPLLTDLQLTGMLTGDIDLVAIGTTLEYDAQTFTLTVSIPDRDALADDNYTLFGWSSAITDLAGNPLNGIDESFEELAAFHKLTGDINGDKLVGQQDLGILLAAYGSGSGDPNFDAAADLDGDGNINQSDLGTLLANYGASLPEFMNDGDDGGWIEGLRSAPLAPPIPQRQQMSRASHLDALLDSLARRIDAEISGQLTLRLRSWTP